MRGNSLLTPAELPCGAPLHFLVKARNSQGLETTAGCSMPTFDCTFPDGRVDAAYRWAWLSEDLLSLTTWDYTEVVSVGWTLRTGGGCMVSD